MGDLMVEKQKPEQQEQKSETQEEARQKRLEEEKKQENKKQEKQPEEKSQNFKIGEIWIKEGTVALDCIPAFWMDKLRAVGIIEYCKQIVIDYNPADKNRIVKPGNNHGIMSYARRMFRKRR